jgi:hypothetical protein
MGFLKKQVCIASVFLAVLHGAFASEPTGQNVLLTHADAAVFIAKHSGLFDRYVSADADLNECVAFLNKAGVYFNLMQIVNNSEFTSADCARVMGQVELVFRGDAEFVLGKVKLPKDIDSWEKFCILNDIKHIEAYEAMLAARRLELGDEE